MNTKSSCNEYTIPQFLDNVKNMSEQDLIVEHSSIMSHQEYYRKNLKPKMTTFGFSKRIPSVYANEITGVLDQFGTPQIVQYGSMIQGDLELFKVKGINYFLTGVPFEDKNSIELYKQYLEKNKIDTVVYFVKDSPKKQKTKNLLKTIEIENYESYDKEFENNQSFTEYYDYKDFAFDAKKETSKRELKKEISKRELKKETLKREPEVENIHLDKLLSKMNKVEGTDHVYENTMENQKIKIFVFKGFDDEGKIKSLDDFYQLYRQVFDRVQEIQKDGNVSDICLQSVNGSDKVGTFLTIDVLIRRFLNFQEKYNSYYFKINICEMIKRFSRFQYGLVRNFQEYLFIYGYMYIFLNKAYPEIVKETNSKENNNIEKEDEVGILTKRHQEILKKVANRIMNQ